MRNLLRIYIIFREFWDGSLLAKCAHPFLTWRTDILCEWRQNGNLVRRWTLTLAIVYYGCSYQFHNVAVYSEREQYIIMYNFSSSNSRNVGNYTSLDTALTFVQFQFRFSRWTSIKYSVQNILYFCVSSIFLRIYRVVSRGISHAPQLNYKLKSKRIFILGITQAR